MSTGKVILGIVAGLAAGSILGILFAPNKGSATRKKIMDKGNDYADDLKSQYKEFGDSVSENFESVKQEALKVAEKGKITFDAVKKDANNAASNL